MHLVSSTVAIVQRNRGGRGREELLGTPLQCQGTSEHPAGRTTGNTTRFRVNLGATMGVGDLSEAEVNQLDVTAIVDKDVLRLEVAVHDQYIVEVPPHMATDIAI